MTVTWVVGAGGLLGRHVVSAFEAAGHEVLTHDIPWHDPALAGDALRSGVATLARLSGGSDWQVAWCAGAGVVATPRADLEAEVEVFDRFLRHLATLGSDGALFLASSAGGLYSGSSDRPPFTEDSSVRALAPYGEAKLAMEEHGRAFAASSGSNVLLGRIANLYGPGQNLSKPQGLVSMLCKAQLSGQPLGVFVPLDTLRDYLYVEDAAAMVVAAMDLLVRQPKEPGQPGHVVTKILASGRGTSVAALVGEAVHVFRRRPPIVFGASPSSAVQVPDLRLTSVVWPEVDRLARTPLAVGLAATRGSIARALARGGVASGA